MKQYYQLVSTHQSADIYIYGYIVTQKHEEDSVTSNPLVREIDALEVQQINVYINSMGGVVGESLAIANALQRNKAKVTTHNDSFACSAAVNIFMAGEERYMHRASALFVHKAESSAYGNEDTMLDAANELKSITGLSLECFRGKVSLSDDELMSLFKGERGQGTWILPKEAVEMGFATGIVDGESLADGATQSAEVLFRGIAQGIQSRSPGLEALIRDQFAEVRQRAEEFMQAVQKPPDKPPEEPQKPGENDLKTDVKQLFLGLF